MKKKSSQIAISVRFRVKGKVTLPEPHLNPALHRLLLIRRVWRYQRGNQNP